jgi:hypothetical protein
VKLRKSWLLALGLVVVATGAWELVLRDAGFDPEYADNRALWLSARHQLSQMDQSAIALVGASRMQRAIDVDTLSQELERPVVQLAVEGTSAIPMLENLAADPRFRGAVIYSVAPAFSFSRRLSKLDAGKQADWATNYVDQSRSRRMEQELRLFAQGLFAFRSADAAIGNVASEFQKSGRLAGFDKKTTQRNRQVSMHLKDSDPIVLAAFYRKNSAPYEQKGFGELLYYVSTLVDILQAKGCPVFIVRLPTGDAVLELEKELFSKERFWDLMQQKVAAQFIHFEDYPELAGFVSADGSHVAADSTEEFTRNLASVLRVNGL